MGHALQPGLELEGLALCQGFGIPGQLAGFLLEDLTAVAERGCMSDG